MSFPKIRLTEKQLDHVIECEQLLGISLENKSLLHIALTHASGAQTRLHSNERLEFLGDAVLGFVTCDLLFERYPKWLEGDLTKVKSMVVSRRLCTQLSQKLGIEPFLILGKGMSGDTKVPASLLANVFESILAAIYLDQGLDGARDFLEPLLEVEIENAAAGKFETNHKSQLQQLAQKQFGKPPTYVLTSEEGPDHLKRFQIVAKLGARTFFPAWGNNKKEAEQRAAANAMAEINEEPIPFNTEL